MLIFVYFVSSDSAVCSCGRYSFDASFGEVSWRVGNSNFRKMSWTPVTAVISNNYFVHKNLFAFEKFILTL